MQVRRTNDEVILQNHENRIGALERAPAGAGVIYTDERILHVDAETVEFDGFPDLAILEVTWNAWLADGATVPALMYVAFNDDYPPVTDDAYGWRLDGSESSDSYGGGGGPGGDKAGGVGFFGGAGQSMWGRLRFPDYTRDVAAPDHGQEYLGEAATAAVGGGVPASPDVWQIAGYRVAAGKLTKITFFASSSTDITAADNYAAGSWFALTAYGRP